jgi:hypothetical protein
MLPYFIPKNFTHFLLALEIFSKDMQNFNAVNQIYGKYFQDHQPARAAFQVTILKRQFFKVCYPSLMSIILRLIAIYYLRQDNRRSLSCL